jgi:Methenyl tetrahydrofolate cyclohydrolase
MNTFVEMPVGDFVDAAASGEPVPGGGGIAALAGALGASMASMAANFTVGKPKFAEHDQLMRETLAALSPLIRALKSAVDEDALAFSAISAAYKLPRNDDIEKATRKQAVDDALLASMNVPLAVAGNARDAAELLPALAETGNPNLLSDVEVAAIMLEAAVRAARVNVLVNSSGLRTDAARAAEIRTEQAVNRVVELAKTTRAVILKRRSAP